jgi:hypothetical protein
MFTVTCLNSQLTPCYYKTQRFTTIDKDVYTSGPCPEPALTNSHHDTCLLEDIVALSFHLYLGVPNGQLPVNSFTK